MTEITATTAMLFPNRTAQRHLIDPVAFTLAIVGGPLVVGIMGAPALLIPSFAAIFGGPIYVLAGTPVMLWQLARKRSSDETWSLSALLTHLAIFVPLTILAANDRGIFDGPSFFLIFGFLFAPLWGLVSSKIYKKFERDFYKTERNLS